jgi:dephospho-CoA kinase
MKTLRVGLTGGIASGKSTVAIWMREAGLEVVDADRLVAELYRPGGDGAKIIEQLFGVEYLSDDGSVDHHRVAQRVFSEPEARRQLEAAIHPLVKREFLRIAAGSSGVVVLEAPLLIEAGMAPDFDLIVTVEATTETRIQRAVSRGMNQEEAERRLAAQTDGATRIEAAHHVIHNDGSLADLRREVEELIAAIDRRTTDD